MLKTINTREELKTFISPYEYNILNTVNINIFGYQDLEDIQLLIKIYKNSMIQYYGECIQIHDFLIKYYGYSKIFYINEGHSLNIIKNFSPFYLNDLHILEHDLQRLDIRVIDYIDYKDQDYIVEKYTSTGAVKMIAAGVNVNINITNTYNPQIISKIMKNGRGMNKFKKFMPQIYTQLLNRNKYYTKLYNKLFPAGLAQHALLFIIFK